MVTWVLNNISTIIVCIVLIAIITGVIVHIVKNKRQGKTSCGCGCQNCAMEKVCHSKK